MVCYSPVCGLQITMSSSKPLLPVMKQVLDTGWRGGEWTRWRDDATSSFSSCFPFFQWWLSGIMAREKRARSSFLSSFSPFSPFHRLFLPWTESQKSHTRLSCYCLFLSRISPHCLGICLCPCCIWSPSRTAPLSFLSPSSCWLLFPICVSAVLPLLLPRCPCVPTISGLWPDKIREPGSPRGPAWCWVLKS